jgi:cytochrome P450
MAAHPDVPVTRLASSADPYPAYALLADADPWRAADGWVVTREGDVRRALECPGLLVAPVPGAAPGPAGGTVAWWQSRMARFSDGGPHARRRAGAEAIVARLDPAALERRARTLATAGLDTQVATGCTPADGMALARHAPVAAVAEELGLDPARAQEAASLTRTLTAALSPRLAAPSAPGDPDVAAGALGDLLEDVAGPEAEAVAGAMGILVQAQDATAGLVGNALVAWARLARGPGDRGWPEAAALVDDTIRRDPPVHWTRRTASAPTELAGRAVEAGEQVWLLLARAAATGPPPTFGSGPHACPGRPIAVALARGVLAAVADRGLAPSLPAPPGYEARPNLRIPLAIPLVDAAHPPAT